MKRFAMVGFAVFALLALAGGPRDAGADDDTEKDLIDLLRAKHKQYDPGAIRDMGAAAKKRTDEELANDDRLLDNTHDRVMEKWKAVQKQRWIHMKLTNDAMFQSAHLGIVLFSIESERKDRLQAIEDRDNDGFHKKFGSSFKSIEEGNLARSEWDSGPEHAQAQKDRAAVQKWFVWAITDETNRARTGQSHAMDVLDEMTTEAQDEAAALSDARRWVKREIAKRRGDVTAMSDAEKKAAEADAGRTALHVAPIRTEYEGKTGEAIETLFQVWRGTNPYLVTLHAEGSSFVPLPRKLAEPGEISFALSYARPGTYTADVTVMDDSSAVVESAPITIVVTGEPLSKQAKPDPKKAAGGGPAGGATDAPSTGVPPGVPGTFRALLYGATLLPSGSLDRRQAQFGTPLDVSIEVSGKISGAAKYEMPASLVKDPLLPDQKNPFLRRSFALDGTVDWGTGRVHLEVKDAHEESGSERDVKGQDASGKEVDAGHWRDTYRCDFSAVFEGWRTASPHGQAWLQKYMELPEMFRQADLEAVVGLPRVKIGADGKPLFDGHGCFGGPPFGGALGPDDPAPATFKVAKKIWHTGYDKVNEQDNDETAKEQKTRDEATKSKKGNWYLKILGLADPAAAPLPPAPPQRKDGDLVAFGLWPTKPITVKVGDPVRVRAVGVASPEFDQALNLSDRVLWHAKGGFTSTGAGAFTATTPGTYTITAMGPNNMSSTVTVIVTAR